MNYVYYYIMGLKFFLESRKFNENKMLNKYMGIFMEIMFFYVFTNTILSQIVCITLH